MLLIAQGQRQVFFRIYSISFAAYFMTKLFVANDRSAYFFFVMKLVFIRS